MARRGRDKNPQPMDVVVGVHECMQLKFTPVAGTGIDVANMKRPSEQIPDPLAEASSHGARNSLLTVHGRPRGKHTPCGDHVDRGRPVRNHGTS